MTDLAKQPHSALLLACPLDDLRAAVVVEASFGLALLPAGGAGDLGQCTPDTALYLMAIDRDGAQSAVTWSAKLSASVPLHDPEPQMLLPSPWRERHPTAYVRARETGASPARDVTDDDADADFENDEREDRCQLFVPLRALAPLPKGDWLFANELVPKQLRGGRRFAPRVPTLVTLPN